MRRLISFTGLLVWTLAGCAGSPDGGTAYNFFLTEDVNLMMKGPQQDTPAEEHLATGTRVRILNGGGASTLVETVDRKQGWVPSSALKMQEDSIPGTGPTGSFGSHSGW